MTEVYVVRHRNPGPHGMLDDDGGAVAEEIDERSRIDLAREVLQGGVSVTSRVDAEHQESCAEGLDGGRAFRPGNRETASRFRCWFC